jgi:hypothetical protein
MASRLPGVCANPDSSPAIRRGLPLRNFVFATGGRLGVLRQSAGNSPPPPAFSHVLGLAPFNPSLRAFEEGHSRPARREVAAEFEIPVEAIPF